MNRLLGCGSLSLLAEAMAEDATVRLNAIGIFRSFGVH
jgi:hypothetical protein